jgi:hypothetical protein
MFRRTSIVTGQHYWVTNTQQISDSFRNPMDGSHQAQRRREDTESVELKLLYEKRNSATQIIYKYNVILGQIADRDGSAQELKAATFEAMPNPVETLRTINESVSSTRSNIGEILVRTLGTGYIPFVRGSAGLPKAGSTHCA